MLLSKLRPRPLLSADSRRTRTDMFNELRYESEDWYCSRCGLQDFWIWHLIEQVHLLTTVLDFPGHADSNNTYIPRLRGLEDFCNDTGYIRQNRCTCWHLFRTPQIMLTLKIYRLWGVEDFYDWHLVTPDRAGAPADICFGLPKSCWFQKYILGWGV